MVLLNASSRSRNVASLVVRDQGGGNIKAGLPYIIGRSYSSSISLKRDAGGCTVPGMAMTYTFANESRPVDIMARAPRLRINF